VYIRPSSGALDVKLQHMASASSFWIGGGLESRCVGRVYGADGAVHGTIRTVRNMQSATPNKINLIHWCIYLVLLQKYITVHGSMNVKFANLQSMLICHATYFGPNHFSWMCKSCNECFTNKRITVLLVI